MSDRTELIRYFEAKGSKAYIIRLIIEQDQKKNITQLQHNRNKEYKNRFKVIDTLQLLLRDRALRKQWLLVISDINPSIQV